MITIHYVESGFASDDSEIATWPDRLVGVDDGEFYTSTFNCIEMIRCYIIRGKISHENVEVNIKGVVYKMSKDGRYVGYPFDNLFFDSQKMYAELVGWDKK